ncbi:MAG: hypothetical protein Q9195_007684 [Heterodermia aff. obscurata]
MPKLRKWLRQFLRDTPNAGRTASEPEIQPEIQPEIPPLPVLPTTREHLLTPSPSLENLKPNFIEPNGPFFERLPPELRRQIYLAAFGDHIVHLDLRQDCPRLVEAPKAPTHAQVKERGGERNHNIGPRWACETIDLFYGANTIHISGTVLTGHLSSVLLPQRLSSISSLELVWNLLDYPPSNVIQPGGSMEVYETLMTTIATSLPGLTKLHIWVDARYYSRDPEAGNIAVYESRLFEPADAIVQEHGLKPIDLQLAPNLSLFTGLMRRAERKSLHVEKGGIGIASWRRFWRPIFIDRDGMANNTAGYWVREGKNDTPMMYCGP